MAVVPGTVSRYVLLKPLCPVTIVAHDGKDEERKETTTNRDVAARLGAL